MNLKSESILVSAMGLCKVLNKWALKNLCAWISDCKARMSDEAVPADLFACEDADI